MVDEIIYHTNLTLVNMKYGGSDYISYKVNIGKHEITDILPQKDVILESILKLLTYLSVDL